MWLLIQPYNSTVTHDVDNNLILQMEYLNTMVTMQFQPNGAAHSMLQPVAIKVTVNRLLMNIHDFLIMIFVKL